MKKIFLLLFSLALLTSCNKDDDNGGGNDAILGKWYVVEINNSGALNLQVGECSSQSFIDFKADNTAESSYYSNESGTCVLESSDNDAWTNNGGDKYTFAVPFEDIGSLTGKVVFNSNSQFTFYPDILAGQNTNIVFEKR